MKMERLTLEKLEFYKIRQQLALRAYSEGGRQLALEIQPVSGLQEVKARLDETQEAMALLHYGEPAFLSSLKPVEKQLGKARIAGILSSSELREVYCLLRVSRLALKYTGGASARLIKIIASDIKDNPTLEKLLQEAIDEDGSLRDDASPALRSIRKQVETARQRIKDYLQNFIRSGNNQSLLQDALITERAGRYVVPVKQEYRQSVKGIVHDESASGATVFIEPLAVVEQNNKIKTLEIEEKREVERILRELSSAVAVSAQDLILNLKILAYLDMLFARAHLAFDMNAFRPDVNDRGQIEISRARHPLLGEQAVPVNITLGKGFDILVITGPNTGGKTVVLKTIGLLTIMAMCGLYIPAREKSQISVFENIFVDIGDEQSIEQSLSTFSSHLKNIVHILNNVNDHSLVLLDELGAGTDPVEGAALARAILETMKEKQARVLVTTHQSELKTFAYQNERVENACVEFNPVTLRPTYELTIGTPGQSNAFEIALRLGLKESLVQKARELVPEREMEIGNMIRQLKESRYHFDISSQELEEGQRNLAVEKELLENEKNRLYQEQANVLQRAKQEADTYVRRIKREANEAIDELKDLLKEKDQPPKWHEVEKKSKKIKDLRVALSIDGDQKSEQDIKVGDYVLVRSISQSGYVLEGPNAQGDVVVQIGSVKLTVDKEQVQLGKLVEEKKIQRRNESFLDKAIHISPEIDLRGHYADDALTELDKYLEDANLVGLSQVQIIHGKGTGALRAAVRSYLKGHRYVKDFRDGMREEGGHGVTVISFK
ncbi:MAG: endonuclease MutS2 [Firmicutes bacterium HGW-Firmicutes-15]|nr:MAG: endonuclease MutS2 [Firmicutes bacterium HGW-Firmicutes-15]